jgi:hypothetical protein
MKCYPIFDGLTRWECLRCGRRIVNVARLPWCSWRAA